ncbi:MAG: transposase [Gammaproteobacteria bacterium]|nr:transposase [Gammaproteobacteria bacterium]
MSGRRNRWWPALERVANEPTAIAAGLAGAVCGGLEATNTFHLTLLEAAHQRGHMPYVLNGLQLNRYRDSLGARAKTDASDARLILRHLSLERAELRAWAPPAAGYTQLQRLHRLLPQAGWANEALRCQTINGLGTLTASALTAGFQGGPFRSSDAIIAFLGLDVQVHESGRYHGRQRLSNQGGPELRRLLFLAAMQAARQPACHGCLLSTVSQSCLSKIQALVALARKLARVAFALLKHNTTWTPRLACTET